MCDVLACILSCGMSLRERHQDPGTKEGVITDFRKRFELSQDKERIAEMRSRARQQRERQGKNVVNYLSKAAKDKSLYNRDKK